MLVFISSNKWFRAGYGHKLRAHIVGTTTVQTILDFHDLPVFGAIAYPMIFIAAKRTPSENHRATLIEPPDLQAPYPDVAAVVEQYGQPMPTAALGRNGTWHLATASAATRLAKMRAAGVPLGEYVQGKIYYGVKTGFNEAFIIDGQKRAELIQADPRSQQIIKPLVRGRDIKRWCVNRRDEWLIYSAWDLEIEAYPAIKQHLGQFRKQLAARPECAQGRYNWWCMARYGAEYADEFEKPKIVYQEIATYQAFALDHEKLFVNNKVFMICADDIYLLAVINSEPAWSFLNETVAKMVAGAYAMQLPYVEQIPIPAASAADRATIAALAQKCLDARGIGCEQWEKEINERVAALYGIAPADIGVRTK